MIITRTPFRIPLGGGGTDVLSYSSRYGGLIVSAAIDKYMVITVNRRKLDNNIRISYSRTENVNSVDQIQHPIVREALKLTGIDGGIEITSMSDVPSGSGLGTSGAFTVGLLSALHTLKKEHIHYMDLAEEACKIEIEMLHEPIGKHDQYMSACGGVTCLQIEQNGEVKVSPAKIREDVLEELERNVLLFYTGLSRRSSDVLSEQSKKVSEKDHKVTESLHKIKEIGKEVLASLEGGDLRRFGELLHEHWETKKSLSGKVSGNEIDRWYQLARENGALGGKIMGAGGGGFFMFYCENGKDRLRKALADEGLTEMRFHFDFEGSKVLVNF